jgi:hypothetical protein
MSVVLASLLVGEPSDTDTSHWRDAAAPRSSIRYVTPDLASTDARAFATAGNGSGSGGREFSQKGRADAESSTPIMQHIRIIGERFMEM